MSFSPPKKIQAESESLDQYLREISAYPLIDRAAECSLAEQIRAGDPMALEKLVRANLRFVVAVAKKYQNQGVSLADLINEGNIGLMRAARKFDETKGIKFISYAVWWIRQAILQALAEQSRIVRVPLSRAGAVHRIGKRSSAMTQELGREPTLTEIAAELEVPEDEISHALAMSQVYLSLDAPLVPGEDGQLLDYLSDALSPGPDDEVYDHARSAEVALKTLARLDPAALYRFKTSAAAGCHRPGPARRCRNACTGAAGLGCRRRSWRPSGPCCSWWASCLPPSCNRP